MDERIIIGPACLDEGAAWLARRDPVLADALRVAGALPLRLKPDGFAALLDAIVSQQVSVASANAIWGRLERAGLTEETAVALAADDDLRACGLSRPKARYAGSLARARVDYAALRHLPSDEVIARLIALPGIGRWTAEIYVMFSLGRADVFASGDLALQEAARHLYNLPERPDEKVLRAMAQAWSPWRAVAARALWAYYRHVKSREGTR
ncbi:DNA-3-methyladenine glycosylase 2 family protein [Defluviimonas sp. WL0002]|uniref:DNA-3-methyladenine glycosylase II n=1 Tax=Albidovulum marisflavi TaxID=2984159 RepID=A0ABT2ZHG1_9RHOB|nr:DNA-3-methyladenine glycosylase 2 family protein [Defluviimonas sp. WL0002]MCV2870569.1 DNA-3-methyladenine glycosylase 2 family protein [Defluviimonas sp. WL0002]